MEVKAKGCQAEKQDSGHISVLGSVGEYFGTPGLGLHLSIQLKGEVLVRPHRGT